MGKLIDAITNACGKTTQLVKNYADSRLTSMENQISTISNKLTPMENQITAITNKLYPVGSIYLSVNNVNPSTILGGTWVAYGASDTYLRLGGNGTGGSNSTSVTLSLANMPSHSHTVNSHDHSIPALSGTAKSSGSHTHYSSDNSAHNFLMAGGTGYGAGGSVGAVNASQTSTQSGGSHTHDVTTNASTTGKASPSTDAKGSGTAFSVNVQPKYVSVYAWKRTA